jgi:hypothetical protein
MKSLLCRFPNPYNFNRIAVQMGSVRGLGTYSRNQSLAISQADDDGTIRSKYRPFLLGPEVENTDWVSELELETVASMVRDSLAQNQARLKVLVLYGSLRKRFFYHISCINQLLMP